MSRTTALNVVITLTLIALGIAAYWDRIHP